MDAMGVFFRAGQFISIKVIGAIVSQILRQDFSKSTMLQWGGVNWMADNFGRANLTEATHYRHNGRLCLFCSDQVHPKCNGFVLSHLYGII
jgi:hypothetical protein